MEPNPSEAPPSAMSWTRVFPEPDRPQTASQSLSPLSRPDAPGALAAPRPLPPRSSMSLLHGIQAHGAHPVDLPGAVPQGPKPPRYLLSTMFDNAHRGAAGGPSVVSLGLRGGAGAVNSPPFEVSALGRQRSAVMMLEGFGSFPISGGGDSGVTPASPPAPRQLPAAGLRPGVSSTGGSSWIPWLESSARRVGLPGGRVTNDGDAPAQAITSRAPSMGEAPSGAAHWAAAASPKGGKPGGPADHARPSAARAVSFKPPRPTSDKDPETDTTRTTAEDAPAKASNHLFRRVRSSRRDSAGERGPHGQKTLRGVTRQLSRYISRKIRIAPEEEQPQETRGQQLWGIVRAVVMVDPNHQDVSTAFQHIHSTFGGKGRAKKGMDAAKYVLMWNVARKLYIRKRLRGEWFPEDILRKNKPVSRFVIHPKSKLRRYWDVLLLFFVLYNAVEVPLIVGLDPPLPAGMDYLEHVITGLFALDIALNFNTGLLDEIGRSGAVNRDRRAIAKAYVESTWFWIDVAATIPFDVIITACLGGTVDRKNLRMLGFLKTPRLLRLSKLLRFLDKMKGAHVFKMIKLVCGLVLFSHVVACSYCLLASLESSRPSWEDIASQSSVESPEYVGENNFLQLYSSAFYQSWTMLTGNGAFAYTVEERFFVSVVMMLGGFVQAIVVGNIALLVQNIDATAAKYRTQAESIRSTAKYLELSESTQDRIHVAAHPGWDGMQDLRKLPKKLYEDLLFEMHGGALDSVPLLHGLEPTFIKQLARVVTSHMLLPEEIVFRKGDLSKEMYFIVHGECVVKADEGRAKIDGGFVSKMRAGSFFGELALLTDIRRSTTVAARTVCDINVLTRLDLVNALVEFPAVEFLVRQRGQRRLNELQEILDAEEEEEGEEDDLLAGLAAADDGAGGAGADEGAEAMQADDSAGSMLAGGAGGGLPGRAKTASVVIPRAALREGIVLNDRGEGALVAELDAVPLLAQQPAGAGVPSAAAAGGGGGNAAQAALLHHGGQSRNNLLAPLGAAGGGGWGGAA